MKRLPKLSLAVATACHLTPHEETVLALAGARTWTHHQIADVLGLSEPQVGELLISALRKVRGQYGGAADARDARREEMRQKSRCIYRGRRRSRLVG